MLKLKHALANGDATPRQPKRAQCYSEQYDSTRFRYPGNAPGGTSQTGQQALGLDRVIERAIEERKAD